MATKEESILKDQKGIVMEENTRQKNDFLFMRNDTNITFNTYFDPKTGHKFAPNLSLIGPANHNVTWRGIINSVTLVMGMAMPAARVAKLFGANGFSRANILRYMGMCAEALAPIYLHFGTQIAQSEVIEADDTNTRVHELNRYFRKIRAAEKNGTLDSMPLSPPWEKNPKEGEPPKKEGLFQKIDENWSFVSKRQDGKGDKQQLHTTCLSALEEQSDPCSRFIL